MSGEDGRPGWDEEIALDLIGSIILVGVTRYAHDGEFLRQEQMYGKVLVTDRERGICIELAGSRAGEQIWLPPTTEFFEPASPGVYTLRSTGEDVENPDYTVTFSLTEPPPDWRPPGSEH